MLVDQKHYRTIWLDSQDDRSIKIIDQRSLPHQFVIEEIRTVNEMAVAIKDMHLRGAGLIGAAAAWGMYLACINVVDSTKAEEEIQFAASQLLDTRPTAINLSWAINKQLESISEVIDIQAKIEISRQVAIDICNKDVAACQSIGRFGVELIKELSKKKNGKPVNILTHCNAGWLAFVDYGSATAPIYKAQSEGVPVHVWVDETRPRNQGARSTAWELKQQGIQHTVIADNTGGHLMQNGLVDLVLVGSDRTTYTGDVANKIGTYLKALAAHDNDVPFYVALPSSSIDWNTRDGINIPIEERDGDELKYIAGWKNGKVEKVLLTEIDSPTANFSFDVTPGRLVSGLITELGICKANEESIAELFNK